MAKAKNNLATIRKVVDKELEAHADVIGEVPDAPISWALIILDSYGLLNHDAIEGFSAEEWRARVQEAKRAVFLKMWAAPAAPAVSDPDGLRECFDRAGQVTIRRDKR